ncbi:MAG: acetamidase/formamidase family protein [Vicinamibacteria bacterium]|nr:acetamidase/formamidase family protein [Vicinamibacteria bacterium]
MNTLSRTAILVLLSCPLAAQNSVSGEWMLTLHEPFGPPGISRLSLLASEGKITGSLWDERVQGTVRDDRITFKAEDVAFALTLQGETLEGEATSSGETVRVSAVRIPQRPAAPHTHDFEPTAFHEYFSSQIKPALHIQVGDTVRTWAVDAGGRDHEGSRRSAGGNPQTGPFFVDGAVPGDTLVVRLNKVAINRDWARSGSGIMRRALEPETLGAMTWAKDFPNRWQLDPVKGLASLEKPTEALKRLVIPLRPMLGCIAVAPPESWSIRTRDSGSYGGNMDYNEMREGTTLYLPVFHPGALLFLGDGHAAQGDGELTGDALETSMDFEFTVDVIPGRSFGHPLAENADFLISIGIGGSLDRALQQATSGMVRWLERDYGLNANESAMLLGFAAQYDVVDLVGSQVSMAMRLPKTTLGPLTKK